MNSHSKAMGPGSSPVPSGPGLGTGPGLQFSDCGVTVSPPQAAGRTGTNTVFVKSQSDTNRRQSSYLRTETICRRHTVGREAPLGQAQEEGTVRTAKA